MLKERAVAAGLQPAMLAEMLGIVYTSARRALDRDAPEMLALIAAWEIMSPDQRLAWLAALGVDAPRPTRGRPRKVAAGLAQNHFGRSGKCPPHSS